MTPWTGPKGSLIGPYCVKCIIFNWFHLACVSATSFWLKPNLHQFFLKIPMHMIFSFNLTSLIYFCSIYATIITKNSLAESKILKNNKNFIIFQIKIIILQWNTNNTVIGRIYIRLRNVRSVTIHSFSTVNNIYTKVKNIFFTELNPVLEACKKYKLNLNINKN